jgi:hypothetical protein
MIKPQVRRVFGSMVLAVAFIGCGPMEESAMPEAEVAAEGEIVEMGQSVSLVSGYNIALPNDTATYTNHGYVVPRWTAPSNHSTTDWVAVAVVGSPLTSFVSWQHVGAAGATKGIADQVTIPGGSDTSVQYEVRYFLNNTYTLAAHSAPFNTQKIPIIACGTKTVVTGVPSAHYVTVGNTGTVNFAFDAYGVRERFLVFSGGVLLYDSGCVVGAQPTVPVTFNNTNGYLRVAVQTACDGSINTSTAFEWTVSCP